MVWITVCLVGAWVGMVMRQGIEYYFERAGMLLPVLEETGEATGELNSPYDPRLETHGLSEEQVD